MNVVYIHTHDMGRYISPYGYNVPTPNLMKLAQDGTLFRHAYCAGPTCSPSRAALLTGTSPHTCGMLGLAHRGFELHDYSRHIVQFLNKQGYETVLCGIQHEAPLDEMLGYRRLLKADTYSPNFSRVEWDMKNAELVVQYLQEAPKKPFFLSYGLFNPHREFPSIDPEVNPDYVVPPAQLYDTQENRMDMAAYISGAKAADKCIGLVMDALKAAALEEDTLVIFTTDHGIAFPLMKCNLYDTGIGVSLIIKYTGNKLRGKATDSLVSHLDIFPTICELLNTGKPDWLEGNSLVPILEAQTKKVREEVFSEVTFHAAYEPMRCIRTNRFKLIMNFGEDSIVPSNIDDGISKDYLVSNGFLKRRKEQEMLFDLYMDPSERNNLVNIREYEDTYKDLKQRLDQWMKSTNDPLLKGYVEKPIGAKINKSSCLSPRENDFE